MNPEYNALSMARYIAKKQGNTELSKELLKQMRTTPTQLSKADEYVRVNYVRYADDFVICINGSKETAARIKGEVGIFLQEELCLELSEEKTLITNLSDQNVKFLGYEISKSHCNTKITENSLGVKKRAVNGTIQLLVPREVINQKLKPFLKNNKSMHYSARVNLPVLDIISQYNDEIRGLYNYYCLATDVSTKIGTFKYYHYVSLAKTIALKEKISVKQVIEKYGIDVPRKQGTGTRKVIGMEYETQKGKRTLVYFNDSLKKQNKPRAEISDVFSVPTRKGCQLIQRLNANRCELCGMSSENRSDFEVHHIRKLKDIKQKYIKRGKHVPKWVLTMAAINRKTLIVCKNCHTEIHAGTCTKKINERT